MNAVVNVENESKAMAVDHDVDASGIHPLVKMFAEGNLDIEKFNQLMDAQKQIDAHQAVKAFNQAMSNFRAEIENVKKSSKGNYGYYADLGSVAASVAKPLANNGLNYRWTDSQEKGELTTTCIITHSMGHSESTTLTAPLDTSGSKNAVQQIGSTKTYLNRYTLLSALGLGTEDDDGQSAKTPSVEMLSESDMVDIKAVCEEVGKDYDKWLQYMSKKQPLFNGLLQAPKSKKTAMIAEIRSVAKNTKKQ